MAETTTAPDNQPGGALRQLGGCLWNLVAIGAVIFLGINYGDRVVSLIYPNLGGSPQLVNSFRSVVVAGEWPVMLCVPSLDPQPDNVAAPGGPLYAAEEIPAPRANALANLRSGPARSFFVVRVVGESESLHIIAYTEENGERWYLLRSGEWILAELVDNPPTNLPLVTLPNSDSEGEEASWNGLT